MNYISVLKDFKMPEVILQTEVEDSIVSTILIPVGLSARGTQEYETAVFDPQGDAAITFRGRSKEVALKDHEAQVKKLEQGESHEA